MLTENARLQRALTIEFVEKKRITAPTVWLTHDSSATPPNKLDTHSTDWLIGDDDRSLALRLVDGFIELKIKASDSWTMSLFAAFQHLRIDARAAYGPGRVASILLKIEDPGTIERWTTLWPRGARDANGDWMETSFASSLQPTTKAKAVWRESSPLPGSPGIVWRPSNKPPADILELGIEDLEPRPIAPTSMEAIVRAVAYATLAYWIRVSLEGLEEWDESLARTIAGWAARLVGEGQDINARGKSLEGVCWAPIDSDDASADLVKFLGQRNLPFLLDRALADLERSPVAPVPGWNALERALGIAAKLSIRRAFKAGLDIDAIERMSERYVLDTSTHTYLDREALIKGLGYEHKLDDLVRIYDNAPVFVGKKALNPFKLYAASQMRTDVERADLYPAKPPGSILRYSAVHGLLNGEDRHPDEYRTLNVFRGFAIKPIAIIDQAIMARAVSMLDTMLGLLTRDNDAQMMWLKKNLAWTIQHPEQKQQVCPIMIGGQGIGKSLFGDHLMHALLGELALSTSGSSMGSDKFLITPFIGKLVTFLDEVKLEAISAINEIKKIIRGSRLSGQVKFGHHREYYIPSRMIIASNQADIGLTPEDAADRAFFFIIAWTAENKRMTDREFLDWSLTLKPFYREFVAALESVTFKQHLMRYFVDLECTREELEDLKFSSRDDENVVRAMMSKAREVARAIVADARVHHGQDITAWFNSATVREAIKRIEGARSNVEASQVMIEFERAGLLESVRGDLKKFRWGYGKILDHMSTAHGLPVTPNFDFKPGDFDDNDIQSANGGPTWRGLDKQGKQQRPRQEEVDPDYMGSF